MNTLKTKSANDGNLSKLAVGKSLLKEYKTSECTRTVYLNDGDEFQIQLFNPETTEIGAEIFIDNEPLSNIIILNPGERMWLERYTDKAKKFKFKVYTVDGDSKAVEKAIAHNGEIKIKFYRKQQPVVVHTYHSPTYIYKEVNHYPWTPQIYYCNSISTCDTNNLVNYASDVTSDKCDYLTLNASCNLDVSSVNYCSAEIGSVVDKANSTLSFETLKSSSLLCDETYDDNLNLIETGRVAEGSYSDQKFQDVDINLEYIPFRTEEFKILPLSRKPFTSNDARKLYCSHCGRKLNTKFMFCPYCGERID